MAIISRQVCHGQSELPPVKVCHSEPRKRRGTCCSPAATKPSTVLNAAGCPILVAFFATGWAALAQQSTIARALMMKPPAHLPLRRALLTWYDQNRRDLPWRRTCDPYHIWISEIMLQQTRVAAVIPRYEEFLLRFPSVQKLAAARESAVLAQWSGLGYYRRARNLHTAAKIIAREKIFPQNAEAWRTLPGIGRYTAAAIASIAFNEPVAVLDGNVERVLRRVLALASAKLASPKLARPAPPATVQCLPHQKILPHSRRRSTHDRQASPAQTRDHLFSNPPRRFHSSGAQIRSPEPDAGDVGVARSRRAECFRRAVVLGAPFHHRHQFRSARSRSQPSRSWSCGADPA